MADRISASLGQDGIAHIAMHDAVGHNALSEAFVTDLSSALHRVADWDSLKVLVLLGLPEVFCSGASRDVLESLTSTKAVPPDLLLTKALLDVPAPTIAAMEGHALGGGLALGVSADLVVIARESRYGCPFMNMGFTPGMGLTRLLEHVLSPAIAHEMMFTGEAVKGSHFVGCSGFNYILPRAEVRAKAFDLADRIAEKPRLALVALKQTLAVRKRQAFEAAQASEAIMHQVTFAQDDIHQRIFEQFVG